MSRTFKVRGMTYRVIRMTETIVDHGGTRCAGDVDNDQQVLWIDPATREERIPVLMKRAAARIREETKKKQEQ